MKDTKLYAENRQLPKEGYLQEVGVEPQAKAGVLSISSTSEIDGNDGNEHVGKLMEQIPWRKALPQK
ncbi:MAG TPA: hypothetical protein PLC16_12280 [Defluviitaleaceae bacterium]|nr:hypothetical protein [Defluviitaleaceae bacterium]